MSQQTFTSQQTKHQSTPTQQKSLLNQSEPSFNDYRPETAAQAKLKQQIQSSPKIIAQRKAHEQMFGNSPVQMMDEEELMQGKFNNAPPIQKKAENGLPSDLNSKLESTLNSDFSGVNIHANSDSAVQMNALAYAQGNDVHFAPGQFKPNTASGQQLIGHEFAHVVQQAEGGVQPTTEIGGMPVNDNKGLESEADKIGDKISRL